MRKYWIPYFFLLLALISFGLTAYHYVELWRGDSSFYITQPERDLVRVVSGKGQMIYFAMGNPTRSPVRVVGMREC